MTRTPEQLREDLLAIWQAGVEGVKPDRLVRESVSLKDDDLEVCGLRYPLAEIDRIVVVGGGKASGSMAESLESVLEPILERKNVVGWINVPEDAAKPLRRIRLHPARPLGVNEPTEAAATGTREMIRLLESLTPGDLCLNLLSGGGSALLPAPVPEIPLEDKLELTRFLSESGATIQELNTVRKQLSLLKGGGMKSLCRGKRLISLILSDVLGDPLDVIASGPTVSNRSTAPDALEILRRFMSKGVPPKRKPALERIVRYLERKIDDRTPLNDDDRSVDENGTMNDMQGGFVRNVVIGNLAVAVDAAGEEALRRGYSHAMHAARESEGLAEELGVHLARLAFDMRRTGPDCLIHGGEPVVRLAPPEIRGKGGRNQQLVLAALLEIMEHCDGECLGNENFPGIAILSGGTDGEDGPTDAAGAWIDPMFGRRFREARRNDPSFDPRDFLERDDAYRFFEPFGTLIKTGSTGTNVCDLRVVLVDRIAGACEESRRSTIGG